MKRLSVFFIALAILGGFIWISRNDELVKVDSVSSEGNRVGSNVARNGTGSPSESAEIDGAGESSRHAAGDLEIAMKRKARLAELDKSIKQQEDKVEERRKVLAAIVRSRGIIDQGGDRDGSRDALGTSNALQVQGIQLESQINSLLKYNGEQLMIYASGIGLPDNTVKQLYPKCLEAKRELAALDAAGVGDEHPSMKAGIAKVNELKSGLDQGIVALRATLQAQLEMTNGRSKHLESEEAQARDEAIKKGLAAQDYVDAKRDFETDLELQQQMKLLRITENLKE
jgi:succinoglycan biosynthesis transport protein ExoP